MKTLDDAGAKELKDLLTRMMAIIDKMQDVREGVTIDAIVPTSPMSADNPVSKVEDKNKKEEPK